MGSKLVGFSLFILCIMGCSTPGSFDLQGHRGCRGLMPENTLPAFSKAIALGVNTLEMDLVVTKDGQLVVSHEPYFSSEICLDREGNEIPDSLQFTYNIYQMTYEDVKQFDCGMKPHPRFPEQEKRTAFKPRLVDIIEAVEADPKAKGKINYNLEIKSQAGYDGVFHPTPTDFSDLVYRTISEKLDWSRVTIQSFDFRVLTYFHATYPDVSLALLIENELPFQENIDSLVFKPDIYSCYFKLLSNDIVNSLHAQDIRVIPWTVNEIEDMDQMKKFGVDGLITDYPNRFNR